MIVVYSNILKLYKRAGLKHTAHIISTAPVGNKTFVAKLSTLYQATTSSSTGSIRIVFHAQANPHHRMLLGHTVNEHLIQ